MNEDSYVKLARVLDTLPNGFPATADGIELRLLKKIFDPDEAELFCRLKLYFETSEQISQRTGISADELVEKLEVMKNKGQILGIDVAGIKLYRMVPWAFGIYELQMSRIDREMAEMCEQYENAFGKQFFENSPPLMQVIPVETEIAGKHQVLPHERVSTIIENSKSFMYIDCICKKEKALLGKPCDRPVQVCTVYAPIEGMFDDYPFGTSMTKKEAYDLLQRTEEHALVHLTWNIQNGHYFICNCCGCCCGVLRGINEMGFDASQVVNSYYYARIDPDACTACGLCADERCQVNAIEPAEESYRVISEKCIGCGLCVTACPAGAISLIRKPEEQIQTPPEDEMQWYELRAKMRGVDISRFT
ncbi:MAG: 4Fe-4S binding protein [Desulfobacteraceae bacterium]|nr:4Fe-4S binding protein [Desulfobacteraceae bacterium]